MHEHHNVKTPADANTDKETIDLDLGYDDGDSAIMEIEVKYLCCPTPAPE